MSRTWRPTVVVKTPPKLKCDVYCSGNAIARFVCAVCHVGLCQRHTYKDENGIAYCKEHKQGYV